MRTFDRWEDPLKKPRVIVADDNAAFLQKLTSLLSVEFDVVATAADGRSALALIRRYDPDVVVLDLEMPALNGIQVARELAKHGPPVVICSMETDLEVVEAARQAGALEYVFKLRVEKDLILAVKSALDCHSFVLPGPE
jgi:DNA-binding NarL/FixJ family response regulator